MEGASRARITRATAVLAMALVALHAGCGDSDDDKINGKQSATTSPSTAAGRRAAATTSGSDEQQITATLHYVRNRFNAGDGDAVCAKFTSAARKKVTQLATITNAKGDCGIQLTAFAKSIKRGQRPVKVKSVRVDGDRAVVVSKGGLVGRSMLPLRMVKVDGEWKLVDTAPVTDDVARAHLRG